MLKPGNITRYMESIEGRFRGAVTPGYACAVLRNGEAVYRRCFGYANLEWEARIDSRTRFHIASLSKQFTALAILALIERGRLALETDARELCGYISSCAHRVRIVDLLHHCSGIPDYATRSGIPRAGGNGAGAWTASRHDYLSQERVRSIIAGLAAQQRPPGHRHDYSNANYVILGDVVHSVSGTTLADFIRREFLIPLEMTGTLVEETRFSTVRFRASAYRPDYEHEGAYHTHLKNFDMTGDCGILTDIDDMLKWERYFHDHVNVPDSPIHRMMNAPTVPIEGNLRYGFGVVHGEKDDFSYESHGGRMEGFKALTFRVPAMGLSFVYLANCDVPSVSSDELGREIASLLCE